MRFSISHPTRLDFGIACGVAIALVDGVASGGEVSPVVVVALLLAASAAIGALWGFSGWPAAVVVWAAVPAPHAVKLSIGLTDTLHPNTWASIAQLAGFTAVVVAIGGGGGALLRAGLAGGRGRGARR
jgi:hypothetical protein